MFHILVCEDDMNIQNLIFQFLQDAGYSVFSCTNGMEALNLMEHQHIDMLVTDVMMPDMDGFTLSRELREANIDIPILVITAKGTIDDKKTGFTSGADDYMVKPFDMDELVMRTEALLRRSKKASRTKLNIGTTKLDYDKYSVQVDGVYIELSQKEFQLLFFLLSNPGRIYTRMQIMDEIWGYDTESTPRTVDVHIHHLREKFADSKDFEILTAKGIGYKAVTK
ncbi:MAG: response regulator transcription factor [Ruminococcus sp.]|nr:response regulator transcription factor [Ruminococcus sp.]